jgi:hypothetical protein
MWRVVKTIKLENGRGRERKERKKMGLNSILLNV